MTTTEEIATLAAGLDEARRTGVAIPQLATHTALSLDEAYAVQRAGVERRIAAGEQVVGAKLGLTSKAKAQQMGVDDVIIGVLTDAMQIPDGGTFVTDRGVHPRVEPEVAFRLSRDVDPRAPDADLRAAIDAVAPALEIIDSRYRDFKFSLADVVADNTSGSAFVIGPWTVLNNQTDMTLSGRAVELLIDGVSAETGVTTDILGDPWEALPATLRMAALYGQGLRAGGILLAGAATAAVAIQPGSTVRATVAGLGEVSVRATESSTGIHHG